MNTLPPEIITSILEYLSFEDRRQMALVNTVWNYASLHPVFLKKEALVYNDQIGPVNSSKYRDFNRTFLNSKREFLNIKLSLKCPTAQCEDVTIFLNLGVHLKFLHLEGLRRFSNSFLDSITSYCINIESLVLKKTICKLTNDKNRTQLKSLTMLTIDSVRLSDKSFNVLTDCLPNLRELAISSCPTIVQITTDRGVYPTFESIMTLYKYTSNEVLTDINIIHYLTTAKYINSLRLSEYSHMIFIQLPKCIKFNNIILNSRFYYYQRSDFSKFISLLGEQTSLQRLDITCCLWCNILPVITSKLHNLKHLTIILSKVIRHWQCETNAANFAHTFFNSLISLRHIRSLTVNFCTEEYLEFHPKDGPVQMFEIPNFTLNSLTTLNCPIQNGLKLVSYGENLRTLEIPNGEILTASNLKLLFKNLINLRKLVIRRCTQLDDDVLAESPISNLKGLIFLDIDANLTYQCFPYIKLMDLKYLKINWLSLNPCIDMKDITDFSNSLKEFGTFVPALVELNFMLLHKECTKLKSLGIDLFDFNAKVYKSYFYKLKRFVIDKPN